MTLIFWPHHTNQVFKERKWLGNISLHQGQFLFKHDFEEVASTLTFREIMDKALELEKETAKAAQKLHIPDQTLLFNEDHLRWILLPFEAKAMLCSRSGSAA